MITPMRFFIFVLLLLLGVLQYKIWFSQHGMREVTQLKKAIAMQQKENDQLTKRNDTLEEEVRELKQGKAAAEKRARYDLGMVKKNETYYQFVH